MKILVIEDKAIHCESAKVTLSGHDVTIVSSFDGAMDLMEKKIDQDKLRDLLAEAGFPKCPDQREKERWVAYWQLQSELEPKCVIPFPFEVVLTDMMLPMSRKTLGPRVYKPDEQVPYGFTIALKATLRGAKFVAMLTDSNHHEGPLSAALDHLGEAYYPSQGFVPNFSINGARVMFVHTPFCRDVVGKRVCRDCSGSGAEQCCRGCGCWNRLDIKGQCPHCSKDLDCLACEGSGQEEEVQATKKDWGKVLADLTQR